MAKEMIKLVRIVNNPKPKEKELKLPNGQDKYDCRKK